MAQHIMIAKTHKLEVEDGRFSQDIRDFIWNYGLRQILNDAGSSGKSPDEKLAMAEKKLAALYEGVIRKTREAKNPLDAIALRMAKAVFKNAFGWGKGLMVGKFTTWATKQEIEFDADNEEDLARAIDEALDIIANTEGVQTKARAELNAPKLEIDLDAI